MSDVIIYFMKHYNNYHHYLATILFLGTLLLFLYTQTGQEFTLTVNVESRDTAKVQVYTYVPQPGVHGAELYLLKPYKLGDGGPQFVTEKPLGSLNIVRFVLLKGDYYVVGVPSTRENPFAEATYVQLDRNMEITVPEPSPWPML